MRKLIGRGSFTKAYQISDSQVEIISTCPAKECYAMFSQDNPFAPKIERNYEKEGSYLMPLYPKIKAPKKQLNARAYEIYTILRSFSITNYYDFVKVVEGISSLTEEEKENLISLASDVCNGIYPENMRFEISPRNISHDAEGNLIMLDCFFCVKALQSSRSR